MTFGAITVLALGVAMDAAAAAAVRGSTMAQVRAGHVLLVAGFFGGFQVLMPLLGWWFGVRVGPLVAQWDHWLAFALLVAIGAHMLWEAYAGPKEQDGRAPFALTGLLGLAIATNVDALAVGITLPMLGAPLGQTVLIMGLCTASLSAVAMVVGHKLGATLGPRLDALGGLVIIALGVKILIEHLGQ